MQQARLQNLTVVKKRTTKSHHFFLKINKFIKKIMFCTKKYICNPQRKKELI